MKKIGSVTDSLKDGVVRLETRVNKLLLAYIMFFLMQGIRYKKHIDAL